MSSLKKYRYFLLEKIVIYSMKVSIPTFYTLYSYFVCPSLFIDTYYPSTSQQKKTPLLIFTPFPSILYLSKPNTNPNPKNISQTEIDRFIERIKNHSFKPNRYIENTFEEH